MNWKAAEQASKVHNCLTLMLEILEEKSEG